MQCRKITASMFTTLFIVANTHLKHLRGESNLTTFTQSQTVASGSTMTSHFCSTCGSLMYRTGSKLPGTSLLRLGTVDDFRLHETKLKPTKEIFTKDRVCWLGMVEGLEQVRGSPS
ncbi:hypothetical protein OQA88_1867 [Cercophora sp. LCS_1]